MVKKILLFSALLLLMLKANAQIGLFRSSHIDQNVASENSIYPRAQIMMFLWAAAGRPEPETDENPFTDVAENKYYYSAVLWAVENGITGGIAPDKFGPNNTCTRAQIVTFLYKAESLLLEDPLPDPEPDPEPDPDPMPDPDPTPDPDPAPDPTEPTPETP